MNHLHESCLKTSLSFKRKSPPRTGTPDYIQKQLPFMSCTQKVHLWAEVTITYRLTDWKSRWNIVTN